jgi:hypothetical protein
MLVTSFTIRQQDILDNCPNCILSPSHLEPISKGEKCPCFNRDDEDMEEWGYVWDTLLGHWVVDETED